MHKTLSNYCKLGKIHRNTDRCLDWNDHRRRGVQHLRDILEPDVRGPALTRPLRLLLQRRELSEKKRLIDEGNEPLNKFGTFRINATMHTSTFRLAGTNSIRSALTGTKGVPSGSIERRFTLGIVRTTGVRSVGTSIKRSETKGTMRIRSASIELPSSSTERWVYVPPS